MGEMGAMLLHIYEAFHRGAKAIHSSLNANFQALLNQLEKHKNRTFAQRLYDAFYPKEATASVDQKCANLGGSLQDFGNLTKDFKDNLLNIRMLMESQKFKL